MEQYVFDDDVLANMTSEGLVGGDVFGNGSDSNMTSRGGALPWIVHTTKDFRLATAGIGVFGLIGECM